MSTALILGATSDIALALAAELARAGHDLLLAARDPARLEEDAQDLRVRFGRKVAITPAFDAEALDSHAAWIEALPALPDLAALVFGHLGDEEKALGDPAERARIANVNYTGAVAVADELAVRMAARGSGTLVGISSVAGDRGRGSNLHYGSAKAGFTAFLSGLRNRFRASGVKVVTVKPGFVATRMTEGMDLPARLTATPEKVARDIVRAIPQRDVVYTPWFWRCIMLVIRLVPEPVFKRLKL